MFNTLTFVLPAPVKVFKVVAYGMKADWLISLLRPSADLILANFSKS